MEAALAWFDDTHELERREGHVGYRRTGLPGPGSIGQQDARLMAAMDVLQAVHDELLHPPQKHRLTDDGSHDG